MSDSHVHISMKECSRVFRSGKTCEKQVSRWVDGDGAAPTGYYCQCGAYRGRDGEQPGEAVKVKHL